MFLILFLLVHLSSADILGYDSRLPITNTTTYPFSTIGVVQTKLGTCTGTMIGRRTMLTAFHCLYFQGNILQDLIFTPGLEGNYQPFGSTRAVGAYYIRRELQPLLTNKEYLNDNDTAYDFTIVELTDNIGEETGWMSIGEFSGEYMNPWNFTGYISNNPTPLHQTTLITGYTSYYWHNNHAYNIRTNADYTFGQSGSPLYRIINNTYTIMGVMSTLQEHHNEAAGGPALYKLSQSVLNLQT
jgi:V8-like Glu-specific endopeptidase